MTRHVIYIPGIGDKRAWGQNFIIQYWRLLGLTPHYFPLGWDKPEGFDRKLKKLIIKIDELNQEKSSVSLVGVSAGASAAINTYARLKKIDSVVLICGKINHPETISDNYYQKVPDFKESMVELQKSLYQLDTHQRKSIMSMHPRKDFSVPVEDTVINGSKEKVIPGWSHISGIFFGVTFGGPSIAKFIMGR